MTRKNRAIEQEAPTSKSEIKWWEHVTYGTMTSVFLYPGIGIDNKPVLFIYRKMKEDDKVSREKNPKYESMSLEELKANILEKSRW